MFHRLFIVYSHEITPALTTGATPFPMNAANSASFRWIVAIRKQNWWIQIASSLSRTRLTAGLHTGRQAHSKAQIPCATGSGCTVTGINQLGATGGGTFRLCRTQMAVNLCGSATILADATTIGKGTPSTDLSGRTLTCILRQNTWITGGGQCGEGGSHGAFLQKSALGVRHPKLDNKRRPKHHRPSSAMGSKTPPAAGPKDESLHFEPERYTNRTMRNCDKPYDKV